MPAKRRLAKARGKTVGLAARKYWRKFGGIEANESGGIITDPELAALLGRHPLIAYSDLNPILEQLRSNDDET